LVKEEAVGAEAAAADLVADSGAAVVAVHHLLHLSSRFQVR
jgi:hypothetical protein